jgi:hypothetical protein
VDDFSGWAYWLFVQQSAWIANGIGAVQAWQMGNRRWWSPMLGLVGQVFWFLLALYTHQGGLLIGCALWTFIHGRNLLKWSRELRT